MAERRYPAELVPSIPTLTVQWDWTDTASARDEDPTGLPPTDGMRMPDLRVSVEIHPFPRSSHGSPMVGPAGVSSHAGGEMTGVLIHGLRS